MPEEFDPAWEYWTPSEEMLEVMEEATRDFRIAYAKDGYTKKGSALLGFRFGRGNPDHCHFRLAREKISNRYVADTLKERNCKGCNKPFVPKDKRYTKYCSPICAIVTNNKNQYLPIVLHTGDSICKICGDCIESICTKNGQRRKYCSKVCRIKYQTFVARNRSSRSNYQIESRLLKATGSCLHCKISVGKLDNGLPRLYCSEHCRKRYNTSISKKRKRGSRLEDMLNSVGGRCLHCQNTLILGECTRTGYCSRRCSLRAATKKYRDKQKEMSK